MTDELKPVAWKVHAPDSHYFELRRFPMGGLLIENGWTETPLYTADRIEALQQRVRELEEALGEIHRRTGLLIHQNTGRWDARLEHDRRTVDVLTVNQRIARKALGDTHDLALAMADRTGRISVRRED